jgi:hypothetical protein
VDLRTPSSLFVGAALDPLRTGFGAIVDNFLG